MGTIFSSLNIGRLGLLAQQYTMNVLGNNIANVNTEGYTRRRVVLSPTTPVELGSGMFFGTGVKVEDVQRIRDTFLDIYLRSEMGTLGMLDKSDAAYKQVEVIFNELGDQGRSVSGMLSEFWDAWQTLSTEPENPAMRQTVVSDGVSLASTLRYMRERLGGLQLDINAAINSTVNEINALATEFQELTAQIITSESEPHTANDLRDRRDLILDRLSELAAVTTRDLGNGETAVFIGGSLLASGNTVRALETVVGADGLYSVQWADTGNAVATTGGELKGLIDSRDETIPAYIARLDGLATQIIKEVNRLHSQGNGLTLYTTATSGVTVSDPDALLASTAGLAFEDEIQDGSFWLAVYDADGALLEEHEITVTAATSTLNNIAAQIDSVFLATGNLHASAADNELTIELGSGAPVGATFSFVSSDGTGDTSGLLLAMELNTFFSGADSETMDVSSVIQNNVDLVATASSTAPGDNTIALAIGNLRNQAFLIGTDTDARTLDEYYEITVSTLGVESATALSLCTNQENVVEAFRQQRESYSGVNLDEELANLISVEHAYTAAARYITTIDTMLETLLSIA